MLPVGLLRWAFRWLLLLGVTLGIDTTPPVLIISAVQPFIFHFLVTVQLNEDGTVYCGALVNSGTATIPPSVYQLKSNVGLAGHGTKTVSGNSFSNVVVSTLMPGTAYDVYCFAEDTMLNGIGVDGITASKQTGLVTASGGDYVAPTLEYVAPYQVIESTSIVVYVRLNEDGTVWCVAKRDAGSGTTAPSSLEIRNNVNVDAWGTTAVNAQTYYAGAIYLGSLLEGATYDVYCFAIDMAGNGIDNTPAYNANASAIPATKRAGLQTLSTLSSTSFQVTTATGMVYYTAQPATWNLGLPRRIVSGVQELRDIESWSTPLSLQVSLVSHDADANRGCSKMTAVPPGFRWVALVWRGLCTFRDKALRAHRAGYEAIIVVNHQTGVLPDMTANSADEAMEIPGWIIGRSDGEALINFAKFSTTGPLLVQVTDVRRKPRLGIGQCDAFGCRPYATH